MVLLERAAAKAVAILEAEEDSQQVLKHLYSTRGFGSSLVEAFETLPSLPYEISLYSASQYVANDKPVRCDASISLEALVLLVPRKSRCHGSYPIISTVLYSVKQITEAVSYHSILLPWSASAF